MSRHSDSIQHWLVSNRLYEDNLFYYSMIIIFWFFVGFIFMGFEVSGYSQQMNLLFNFIFYLIICVCMALCPIWFWLIFGRTHTAKREEALIQALDELDDDDRVMVLEELEYTGALAMRPAQRWALVFLGCYFLFEVFFISAWVKELTLVWQPDWATSIIEWVRVNITLPPLNVDRRLFILDIGSSVDKLLHTMYASEVEFLDSNFGRATLLFHFFRALVFLPMLYATYLIFTNMIGWSGAHKFNQTADLGVFKQLKMLAWLSFLIFFLILLAIGNYFAFFSSIRITAETLFSISNWLNIFYLHVGFVFTVIGFILVTAWCKLIKNLILTPIPT